MNILSRYIAWKVFQGILLAFLIVTTIVMLIDFVEGSRNIGVDEQVNAFTLLKLTLLKTPQIIEQTVPFVILFGVMGSLHSLSKRSELTVLRASGLSAWRFLFPAFIFVFLLGIIWSLGLNPLASKAMSMHNEIVATQIKNKNRDASQYPIWLREGTSYKQTVIYAKNSDRYSKILQDATFTVFETNPSGDLEFRYRFDTKKAVLSLIHISEPTRPY